MNDHADRTQQFLTELTEQGLLHIDMYEQGTVLWISKDRLFEHFKKMRKTKLQVVSDNS